MASIKKILFSILTAFVVMCTSLDSYEQVILNANGPGSTYELINSVLAPGYTAVEAPDQCNSHPTFGRHIAEVFDATLNKYVFEFYIHVPTSFPVNAQLQIMIGVSTLTDREWKLKPMNPLQQTLKEQLVKLLLTNGNSNCH